MPEHTHHRCRNCSRGCKQHPDREDCPDFRCNHRAKNTYPREYCLLCGATPDRYWLG